jgi:hypothetical protein
LVTPEGLDIDASRIREQQEREGELRNVKSRTVSEVDVDHVESVRPKSYSHRDKEQRSRQHGILESPGDQCISERSSRQQRQGGHGSATSQVRKRPRITRSG